MSGILSANELKVAKDLSGGIKIAIGNSAGLLSPQQAIEFATVVMKLAGIDVQFSSGFAPEKQKQFLAE